MAESETASGGGGGDHCIDGKMRTEDSPMSPEYSVLETALSFTCLPVHLSLLGHFT